MGISHQRYCLTEVLFSGNSEAKKGIDGVKNVLMDKCHYCMGLPFTSKQLVQILTLYQTTNFRLFQTERLCRRQFQI